MPTLHFLHDVAPVWFAYCPAVHCLQAVLDSCRAVALNLPTVQRMQSEAAVLAVVSAYVPATQEMQFDW